MTLLTPTELAVLLWAVEGQEDAAAADPSEFILGDWDDLFYRIDSQYRDMIDDDKVGRPAGYAGRANRAVDSLLKKLDRGSAD